MATKAVNLEARLMVDQARFAAGIRKAVAETDRLGKASQKANKQGTFRNLAAGAVKAAAAVGGLYAVYDQGKKAINTTADLAKSTIQLTRTTGLSTREASRFVAITKVRGIETAKLTTSFTILSKQIVAASEGSDKAASAFQKLGVSQDAIRRGNTQEVFLQAADGLSKMENGAKKTALAAQLFGRGYQALFPILDLGAKGIREQLTLAGALGAEIGDKGVATYKEYASAQRTAQLALMGLRVQLGTPLLQAFAAVSTVLAKFIVDFRAGTGAAGSLKNSLQGILNTVIALYSPLTQTRNGFANVAAAATSLAAAIGAVKLTTTLAGIGTSLTAIFSNPYTAGAFAIAAAVAAIGAAFYLAYKRSRDFRQLVQGIGKALKPALAEVGTAARSELPKIARAAAQATRATAELFRELRPVIVPVVKAVAKIASTEIRGIGPSIEIAATAIRGLTAVFRTLKSVVSSTIRGAKTIVNAFGSAVSSAMSTAQSAINGVISTLDSLINKLKNLPGGKVGAAILGALSSSAGGVGSGRYAPGRQTDQELANAQVQLQQRIDALGSRNDKNAQRAISRAQKDLDRIQKELNKREAIKNAQDQLRGIIETAKETYRAALEAGAQATFNNATALQRMGIAARSQERERAADTSYLKDKASLEKEIARAQAEAGNPAVQARYEARKAALQARYAAQQQAGNLEAADQTQQELLALEERYGPQRVQILQDQLATLNRDYYDVLDQRTIDSAQAQLEATQAGIDGQVEAWAGGLTAINNLLANFTGNYMDWVAQVNAALPFGLTFTADPNAAATINPPRNLPRVKRPPRKKKRASGGPLSRAGLTMVGETGPELIAGGNVYSATRTARMSGAGVTLNVYPQTTADDPVALARALGWQLASR